MSWKSKYDDKINDVLFYICINQTVLNLYLPQCLSCDFMLSVVL